MTNSCIKTVHELSKASETFADLSIEQLLLAAINGSAGMVEDVRYVLENTNWEPHILKIFDLEIADRNKHD